MLNKRKTLQVVVVILAGGLLAAVIGLWIVSSRVAGIYLFQGGTGYIEIARDGLWHWRVKSHHMFPHFDVAVASVWPRLQLDLAVSPDLQGDLGVPETKDFKMYFSFEPSHVLRGGWDLVEISSRRPTTGRPAFEQKVFRTKRPLPCLYRLDDRRVVEYFDLRYKDKKPEAAFKRVQPLLKDHPDDLHVRALYMAGAAYKEDIEEVGRRLEEWESDFRTNKNLYLIGIFQTLKLWHRARQLSAAGDNAYDFCRRVLGTETDLATRMRLFPQMLHYKAYLVPRLPEVGVDSLVPKLLEIQVSTKVNAVMAILMMIQGKREEPLHLLAATFRLGQWMSKGGILVERLIGIACASIASWPMGIYALNCCETQAEFEQLWRILSELEKDQAPNRLDDLLQMDPTLDLYAREEAPSNAEETVIRMNITDSRFELLRMGTAAKYRFLTNGDFPKTTVEFAPLLPDGPPKDRFTDGPLQFRLTTDSLICYSVGPDKRDDLAAVEYDPTNGTVSAGDIALRVPREREYPFARGDVRAASIADLMRQFPNGLPPDPFATTKWKGLGTTPTAVGGFYIYSYGPNVDQFKGPYYGKDHVLEVQYDPTNGIVSAGDIFIHVPPP